ncbi:FG-GAP repeat protein [Pseudomonadota bacterium]
MTDTIQLRSNSSILGIFVTFIFCFSPNINADFSCDPVTNSVSSRTESFSKLEIDENEIPVLFESQIVSPVQSTPDLHFGQNISLSNSVFAVGYQEPPDYRGVVDLFEYQQGLWQRIKQLNSPVSQLFESFSVVALDDDTLIVGAWGYCEPGPESGCSDGRAFVFGRNEGGANNWGMVKQLDGGYKPGARFGSPISLDKDTAVISAPNENISRANNGAAYVFDRNYGGENNWGLVKRLESDKLQKQEGDFFGYPTAINGDTIVVLGDDVSVVYVFGRDQGGVNNWGLMQKFTVPHGQSDSLAFDGQTLVLRARDPCIPSEERTNFLLFYEKTQDGLWTLQQEIETALEVKNPALDGNQLLVKSRYSTNAYVFQRGTSSDSWAINSRLLTQTDYSPYLYEYGVVADAGRAFVSGSNLNNGNGLVFFYNIAEPINAGHAGTWFNPATSGQGQLIDVEPESQFMFLSWFTFTDADSDHPSEQHWFTAQGNYTGNKAELVVYETLGGKFDDAKEVNINAVGTATLSFTDCGLGRMNYTIDTLGLSGSFPMQRAIPGSDNLCQQRQSMTTQSMTTQSVDINGGMDGVWFDPSTPGQGFLIDATPDPEGGNFIFVAWFTYGDDTASGQRWLTAQGSFEGSTAAIDVYETTGGSFDDSQAVSSDKVGTMTIDFQDCSNALLSYELTDEALSNSIAISRGIPGAQALCEELAGAD